MTSDPREATALVGRVAEMALVRDLIGDVASGSSALLRVSGPPGVGKSRLCRDTQRLTGDAGFVTASCRPAGYGEELPFGAAVQAIGPLLYARTATARHRLLDDLPQIGWLFAGMGLRAAEPLADNGLQRLVLLEELCRLVERISRGAPLLWAVDGLDGIDRASAALLHRLVGVLADRPALLLVTVTDGGAGAIERAGADFGWRCEHIALQPLAEPDAASLAEQVFGGAVAESLRAAIHRRCVGTPLWVVATAQALVDGGQLVQHDGRWALPVTELPIPAGIDEQLWEVVAGLGTAERAMVQALSVSGDTLQLTVLGDAAGVDAAMAAPEVASLERRRLVARTTGGYAVVHGLLREVVLAHLAESERLSTHAALAVALRRNDPDDPRIAEHALLAGPLAGPDLIPDELIRGGHRARALGATGDAYRYLAAAIAADGDRASSYWDTLSAAEFRAEAANLAEACGHPDAARKLWEEALSRFHSADRHAQVATVHRRLAMLDWSQGRRDDAGRHLDAAESALRDGEPGPELGEVLYARTVIAQRLTDAAAVLRQSERLRAIARRIGSPSLHVRAELAAAAYAYACTDYEQAVAHNRVALQAADTADLPLLVRAHDQTSVVAAAVGNMTALREHSTAAVDAAERAGLPQLAAWPRERLVVAELMAGDLDAALRRSADLLVVAERYAPPRGATTCLAVHALLLTYRGRLREARAVLKRSRQALGDALAADRNVATFVEFTAATLALASADPAAAVREGARLADLGGGWMPLLCAALLAEAHATAGHPAEANRIVNRIAAVRSCPTRLPETLEHWIGGLTSPRRDAPVHCAAAAAGFDELGLAVLAHRSRLRGAAATVDRPGGRRATDAAESARRALDFFEHMRAPELVRRARQVLRSLGVTPPRRPAGRRAVSPLSDREMEVARMVARGLSNAAVATELFISPRTVTTHLEHIYGKLGLSSRVALTRYLTDADLLESDRDATESDT